MAQSPVPTTPRAHGPATRERDQGASEVDARPLEPRPARIGVVETYERGLPAGPGRTHGVGQSALAAAARSVDEHERTTDASGRRDHATQRRGCHIRVRGDLGTPWHVSRHAHTGWNAPAHTATAIAIAAIATAIMSSAASATPTRDSRAHVRGTSEPK